MKNKNNFFMDFKLPYSGKFDKFFSVKLKKTCQVFPLTLPRRILLLNENFLENNGPFFMSSSSYVPVRNI